MILRLRQTPPWISTFATKPEEFYGYLTRRLIEIEPYRGGWVAARYFKEVRFHKHFSSM
jgi:hypothetical protein